LAGLGGGCSVPIAAYAVLEDDQVRLQGRVAGVDGSRQVDVAGRASVAEAEVLGGRLAGEALSLGAARLLEDAA
jgi:hydroxymethylbilane synthase